MNGAPASSPGIPPPLDDDDDDVAWALQTAAVQWKREAYADAVVWLRRAVDAAIQAGQAARATELNGAAAELTEAMLAQASQQVPWPPPGQEASVAGDVDELLDAPPPSSADSAGRASVPTSVDVAFDDATTVDDPRFRTGPVAVPPPAPSARAVTAPEAPVSVSAVLDEAPEAPVSVSAVLDEAPEAPVSVSAVLDEAPEAPVSVSAVLDEAPEAPLPFESTSSSSRMLAAEPASATVPAPAPGPPEAEVGGIALASVRGLEDLPEEGQAELAARVKIEHLGGEEEVGNFAVALVISGWVNIMAAIADASCARATAGDVVFTQGSLEDGIALRVVAGDDGAVVAVWDAAAIQAATADCPWVADELRGVADRFQALAGAAMGELGDRFDESLRASVTDRCEVRMLLAGDQIVEKGKAVPGLFIVGAGRIEIFEEEGERADELGPGDFLFSAQVLSASPAPASARAGKGGALLLFAERHAAHELMVSVPPLLEILAG